MNKKITITKILAFSMVLIITFVLAQLSNAVPTPAPGSTEDPLITKSYVDGKVNQLNNKISSLTKTVEAAQKSVSQANASINTLKSQVASLIANKGGTSKYQSVSKSKTIILKVGGQLVLYSGSANVIGKLTDLTDGKALNTNQLVAKNHLIVSAFSDTRGIKAKTDIFVLLSGNYTIK